MKPLVFLYRTAFGFYFYETSRNEIVKVSQALYEYIQAILAGQGEEEIDASEYENRNSPIVQWDCSLIGG